MLDSYTRVLARPGALAFSAAGLLGRMPISMTGLGIVLLVSMRTGSYGLAGALSAAFVAAEAAMALWHGRWVDRWGQSRVLPVAITTFAAALGLLMVAVEQDWPAWTGYALAAVAGASLPQVGACVRTRWSHVLERPTEVQTAYALEAVLDEVVFIVGPVLVTVLATSWHPAAGLGVALAMGVAGTWALSLQRATEPPPRPAGTARRSEPMPWPMVLALAAVCLSLGALFGAAEVATVAFADVQGAPWAAGPLLAVWALGSLVAGLVTGAVQWQRGPAVRLRVGSTAMAVAMVPLMFVDSLGLMALALLIGGLAIAPTMIATMTMVEERVPHGRLTEGIAVLHTGLVAGVAPGAWLAGVLVDSRGPAAAYAVALAGGVAGAAIAVVTSALARPRPAPEPAVP